MAQRIFYVIYFKNRDLQRTLDAMRFLSDPNEKTRAHITIRGPYLQRYNVSRLKKKIQESDIGAFGAEGFFNEGQNTVFIKCDSEELRKVSKKKNFGYNPHITIYDGACREFAEDLFERLSHLNLVFSFRADDLLALPSSKGQTTSELLVAFDEEFISNLLGRPLAVSDVDTLKPEERLSLIETLARKLPEFGLPSSSSIRNAYATPLSLVTTGTRG